MPLITFYGTKKYVFVSDQRHIEDRNFLMILYKIEPKNRNCGKLRKDKKSIFSFNFDSTFMKFEHNINELGSKKTCVLNF